MRKFIKKRSQGICERCLSGRAEQIHHLTYVNKPNEKPEDLQHICLKCHGEYHPHHTFRNLWEQRQIAIKRGKRVPRWKKKKKEPIMNWGKQIVQAQRELKKSALFNSMYYTDRRGE